MVVLLLLNLSQFSNIINVIVFLKSLFELLFDAYDLKGLIIIQVRLKGGAGGITGTVKVWLDDEWYC